MGVIYLRILITPIRCLILHHAFGSCANAYNHFTKGGTNHNQKKKLIKKLKTNKKNILYIILI